MRRFLVANALVATTLVCALPCLAEDKNGVSPSRLKLPKGPGSLEGVGENVEPNLSMGLMTYGVPIQVPQGYEGLTPSLRFSYSSGSGSGELGLGWSLSFSSIERMTSKKGLPVYTGDDLFAANGSDELVRLPNTSTFRARYEGGFVRYTWLDSTNGKRGYWKAEYPDGRVGYFGADATGTQHPNARVEGRDGTFRYLLVEMVDVHQHRLLYEYVKDGGYSLPGRISWVFDALGAARYRVDFEYEGRPDELSDCKSGVDVRLTKRLKGVSVKVKGQQLRRYALTYAQPTDTAGISRLARVQQYGRFDGDGPYPIDFRFTYSDALASQCTGAQCNTPTPYTFPAGIGVDLSAGRAELIDLNGDGLPDVVDTKSGTGNHDIYFNQLTASGTGFAQSFTTVVTSAQGGFPLQEKWNQPVDFDGDGFTDLVNFQSRQWLRNTGNQDWNAVASLPNLGAVDFADVNLRFFDFNLDKRIDVIHVDASGTWVYENTGTGFVENRNVDVLDGSLSGDLQFADMNGDSLLDAVRLLPGGVVNYRLNLGFGHFASPTAMYLPSTLQQAEVKWSDLNGDSIADAVIVQAATVRYWLNRNGRDFASEATIPVPSAPASNATVRLADMNANGTTDVVWFDASGRVTYLELFPTRPNLMRHIETGIGKAIDITYSTAAENRARDAQAGTAWTWRLSQPMQLVATLETSESLSPKHLVQSFRYRDGYYDGEEKQFRGFTHVEATTSAGGVSGVSGVEDGLSVYEFDVGEPLMPTGAPDSYRKALLRSLQTSSSGRPLSRTANSYTNCPLTGVPSTTPEIRYVCQEWTETTLQEGTAASEWVTTREQYVYNGYGDRTLVSKLGVIRKGAGGCAARKFGPEVFGHVWGPDCQGDESFEATDFIAPGTATGGRWLLHKPWRQRSYGVVGSEASGKETLTYYDGASFLGLPQGELTKGLVSLVTTRRTTAGATVKSQRLRYGVNGEVLETLDANNHRRSFGYDPEGVLLATESVHFEDAGKVPYRLVMSAFYDPVLETISSATQWQRFQNSTTTSLPRLTTYQYDGFGRLRAVFKPGDGPFPNVPETPSEEYRYDLKPGISRVIRSGRTRTGGETDLEEVQCFDGKGRKLQTLARISPGVYQSDGWKKYSGLDKELVVAQPFRVTSSDCGVAPPTTLETSLLYDSTGRLVQTTHPDASEHEGVASQARTVFLPLAQKQFDEEDNDSTSLHAGTETTVRTDGLGRKVQIERFLTRGQPVVSLWLTYDELGRLSGYEDVKGNRKTQIYDLLDRITSVVDPDTGTTTSEYDDAGNETERRDARAVVHRKAYDEANRLVAEWDNADPTKSRIAYTYDLVPTGCAATDCSFTEGQLTHTLDPRS